MKTKVAILAVGLLFFALTISGCVPTDVPAPKPDVTEPSVEADFWWYGKELVNQRDIVFEAKIKCDNCKVAEYNWSIDGEPTEGKYPVGKHPRDQLIYNFCDPGLHYVQLDILTESGLEDTEIKSLTVSEQIN